jgi:hypothetical protein
MTIKAITDHCWCGGWMGKNLDTGQLVCMDQAMHDPTATGRPKAVTRLYIAGPMSGYAECNFPAFHYAKQQLQAVGFEVVSPADFGDPGSHYVDLIADDLRAMLGKTKDDACHGVATLDYWWESVGARNEVQVAGILKMPVRTVEDWIRVAVRD